MTFGENPVLGDERRIQNTGINKANTSDSSSLRDSFGKGQRFRFFVPSGLVR